MNYFAFFFKIEYNKDNKRVFKKNASLRFAFAGCRKCSAFRRAGMFVCAFRAKFCIFL